VFVTGRLEPVLESYWGLATTAGTAAMSQLGLEAAELPDADAMAHALDDIVLWGGADEEGFTLKAQQPLGLGSLLPAAAAALEWFLAEAPAAARPSAKKPAKKIY
jgi:hypothetical protein